MSLLLFAGLYASTLLIAPLSALQLLSSPSSRVSRWCLRGIRGLTALWFALACAILECIGSMRIRLFSTQPFPIDPFESTLLLSNHPSTADWMFLWSVCLRCFRLEQLRIMMKSSLRSAPIIGWALQSGVHCFLSRRWVQDESHLSRFISFYARGTQKLQLLMFPEGTDLNPAAIQKSNQFAEKNGVPVHLHTLHPRTTGFTYLMKQSAVVAAESNQSTGSVTSMFSSVTDLTLAFPDLVIRKSTDLMFGHWPRCLHIMLHRYEMSDLPDVKDESATAQWLARLWSDKEARLSRFHDIKTRHLLDASQPQPRLTDVSQSHRPIHEVLSDQQHAAARLKLWIVLIAWIAFISLMTYALVHTSLIRYYMIATTGYFVAVTLLCGGTDQVLLKRNADIQARRRSNATNQDKEL